MQYKDIQEELANIISRLEEALSLLSQIDDEVDFKTIGLIASASRKSFHANYELTELQQRLMRELTNEKATV